MRTIKGETFRSSWGLHPILPLPNKPGAQLRGNVLVGHFFSGISIKRMFESSVLPCCYVIEEPHVLVKTSH